jgi:hypothetical protein
MRALLAVLIAALWLAYGSPVLADESSLRERHPNEVTRTPTPTTDLGDGTALSTEVPSAIEEEAAPPVELAAAGNPEPAIVPIATVAEPAGVRDTSVERPKPTPRSYTNPAANPTAKAVTRVPTTPRLDDPVLRWLPEIMASAKANNVPAELIAGVMRLESNGNPNIISPDGARGLMQIMPDQLLGQGIPEDLWHDPATNIMAGGYELLERSWSFGAWEGAVGSYFGFGCDVFGTCTDVYVKIVLGWAAYYAPIIAAPLDFGFAVLPDDWVPPPIVPFVEAAPKPIEEPPPPPTPTDASPTPTATPTPTPTDEVTQPTEPAEPTSPGEPTAEPTAIPTDEPTTPPTEEPTAPPTEEPTLEPTAEPTAEPTEVPTDEATEPPTEPPTEVPTEEPTDPPAEEIDSGEEAEGD